MSDLSSSLAPLYLEAEAFFTDFAAAFAQFDGTLIAQRYASPYLALNAAGQLSQFADPSQIGAYFQQWLDRYRKQGCHGCAFADLQVVPLGRDSMLASVSWLLRRADGSVALNWRESYTLTRQQRLWRIFASIDHVADEAVSAD